MIDLNRLGDELHAAATNSNDWTINITKFGDVFRDYTRKLGYEKFWYTNPANMRFDANFLRRREPGRRKIKFGFIILKDWMPQNCLDWHFSKADNCVVLMSNAITAYRKSEPKLFKQWCDEHPGRTVTEKLLRYKDAIAINVDPTNTNCILGLVEKSARISAEEILNLHSPVAIANAARLFHAMLIGHFGRVNELFTPREVQILQYTAMGKTASEIGGIVNLTERTIVSHVQNLLGKLNAVNKTHAVSKAIGLGLVRPW